MTNRKSRRFNSTKHVKNVNGANKMKACIVGSFTSAFTNQEKVEEAKDEYFLSSMFPSEDVMHRIYSIMRKNV